MKMVDRYASTDTGDTLMVPERAIERTFVSTCVGDRRNSVVVPRKQSVLRHLLPAMSARLRLEMLVFVALLAFWSALFSSSGACDARSRLPKRILVLPASDLGRPCASLCERSAAERQAIGRELARFVEQRLAVHSDIRVLKWPEVRSRITSRGSYREKMVIGRERFLLGKELYEDLRQKEAEDNLRKSVELLEDVHYDLVEPEAFSQILMLLGVTLIEEGMEAAALVPFRKALLIHPDASDFKGYYPKPMEDALTLACEDIGQAVPPPNTARYVALMQQNGIDARCHLTVAAAAEGELELVLVALDKTTETVSIEERMSLKGSEDSMAAAREEIDRILGRWVACVPWRFEPPVLEAKRSVLFSANFQNLAFLSHPIRSTLTAMGFSFDSAFIVFQSFAIGAKFQLLSSTSDRYGDVIDGFTSARVIVGPAFAMSGQWWRIYVLPGLELHYLGSFTTARDPDCKFFLPDSEGNKLMCDTSRSKYYPVDFLGGVNVSLGSQFFVASRLFLNVSTSISTYFAPFDRSFEMNFPVSLEVGRGVAF